MFSSQKTKKRLREDSKFVLPRDAQIRPNYNVGSAGTIPAQYTQSSTLIHLSGDRRQSGTAEQGVIRMDNQGGLTNIKRVQFLWFKCVNVFYNIPADTETGINRRTVVMYFSDGINPDVEISVDVPVGQYTQVTLAEAISNLMTTAITAAEPASALFQTVPGSQVIVEIIEPLQVYQFTWASVLGDPLPLPYTLQWSTTAPSNPGTRSSHYIQHRVGLQSVTRNAEGIDVPLYPATPDPVLPSRFIAPSVPTLQGRSTLFFESQILRQHGVFSKPANLIEDPDSRKSQSVMEPVAITIPLDAGFGETVYFESPSEGLYEWGWKTPQSLSGNFDYRISFRDGEVVDLQDTNWELVLRVFYD